MTIKLNKTMREEIADDLVRKLEEEVATINNECPKLGKMLYDEMFTTEQQKLMNSLPEGWLPTFDAYWVQHPDDRYNRVALKLNFRERHPYTMHQRIESVDFDKYPKFKAAFLDHLERYTAAREAAAAARVKVMSILNSVTTVNRLLEVWPESRASVERCVSESRTVGKAIAIPVNELNDLLELPEEAVAA